MLQKKVGYTKVEKVPDSAFNKLMATTREVTPKLGNKEQVNVNQANVVGR